MKKIGLFIGTQRGYEVLKSLIDEKEEVTGVLVLEQKEHELSNFGPEIIKLCKKNHIKFKTTKVVKPHDYQNFLKTFKPDIVFVVSWRFLIPSSCFNIPKYGIFILHDSLLPKYRGFSPTNWVIINGEKETGLTLQYINEQMDSGRIVDQIKIKIEKDETATTLNKKLVKIYPEIILRNLDLIFTNKNKKEPQNEKLASYGTKRTPEDGKIDFNNSSKNILQLIRGLSYPYPGAYCDYKDKKYILWEAEIPKDVKKYVGNIPGKIIEVNDSYVQVLSNNGTLNIKQIAAWSSPSKFLIPNTIFKTIGGKLS